MNAESWYAIWTRSHCERLVEQQSTARGFWPFLPEVQAARKTAGRAARNNLKSAPMFPGYLFVRDAMTKERYVEMLGYAASCACSRTGWTRLTPVPESDIDAIRHIVVSRPGLSASLTAAWRPRACRGGSSLRHRRHLRDRQSAERPARCDNRPARTQRGARGQRRGRGQVQLDLRVSVAPWAVIAALIAQLVTATPAHAQAQVEFIPAATIFRRSSMTTSLRAPIAPPARDVRPRPSFEGSYESPVTRLLGFYSFDMQHSNFSSLTTLDARLHALGDAQFRTTPFTTLGVVAKYDRSNTPGDINFDTGILGERRNAERVEIVPGFAWRLGPRTTMSSGYDWISEHLVDGERGTLQTGRVGFSRDLSSRTGRSRPLTSAVTSSITSTDFPTTTRTPFFSAGAECYRKQRRSRWRPARSSGRAGDSTTNRAPRLCARRQVSGSRSTIGTARPSCWECWARWPWTA